MELFVSTEYICILSDYDVIVLKINMAGENTNIGPFFRIDNPEIEHQSPNTWDNSFRYLMEPFFIHLHAPRDQFEPDPDDPNPEKDIYVHVAYLPDSPSEYTVFKIDI